MFTVSKFTIFLTILCLHDASTLGSEVSFSQLNQKPGSEMGFRERAMLGFIANSLVETALIHSAKVGSGRECLTAKRRLSSVGGSRTLMSLGNGGKKHNFPLFKLNIKSIPRNVFNSFFSIACWNGFGNKGMNWAHALEASKNPTPVDKSGKKKILILLSDTGGGHKASAKAITAALDLLYPNVFTCEIADIWTDHGQYPFNTFVSSYQWAAKNPWAWRMLYWSSAFPPTRWCAQEWSNVACKDAFRAYIEGYQPDGVISVHPLCQEVPLRVLESMGGGKRKIPFVTVVTDLGGAHPTWFHKGVDRCFVPGDAVERIALDRGLRPEQVQKHGLPVRQGFWDAGSKRGNNVGMRQHLGLKCAPNTTTIHSPRPPRSPRSQLCIRPPLGSGLSCAITQPQAHVRLDLLCRSMT
jgi:hypothetical protein